MKKLFITLAILSLCFTIGCDKKPSQGNLSSQKEIQGNSSDEKSDEPYAVIPGMPDRNIQHHEVSTFDEFKEWVNDSNSKKENSGSFKELIDEYKSLNNFLKPSISGGKLHSIFMDSNQNHINFVFTKPSMRINIQKAEENNKDISCYMKDNFDAKFNVKKRIDKEKQVDKVKSGYEYEEHYFSQEEITMSDKVRKCVLEKRYSEKSDTEYILSFLEENMLVRIIYYDIGENQFEHLSFKTISLHQ